MQDLLAELTRPVALSDHAVRGLAQLPAVRRDYVNAHAADDGPAGGRNRVRVGDTPADLEARVAPLAARHHRRMPL